MSNISVREQKMAGAWEQKGELILTTHSWSKRETFFVGTSNNRRLFANICQCYVYVRSKGQIYLGPPVMVGVDRYLSNVLEPSSAMQSKIEYINRQWAKTIAATMAKIVAQRWWMETMGPDSLARTSWLKFFSTGKIGEPGP